MCQQVCRGVAAALPDSWPAEFCKQTLFEGSHVWTPSTSLFSLPVAFKNKGDPIEFVAVFAVTDGSHSCGNAWLAMRADRQPHQHQSMFLFSTQRQHTHQEGPDISLLDPALQQQWDHAANANLGNMIIRPKSSKQVQWSCDQCPDGHPHSWSAAVHRRSNGSGCPQCSGRKVCKHNSLATKAPGVAAQWDYEENDTTPDRVNAHSSQVVGWHCDACGHQWTVSPHARVSNTTGCPQCARFARAKPTKRPMFAECQNPEVKALLAQWDHERNTVEHNYPHNTTLMSHKQIHWLCTKCPAGQTHRWSAKPYTRTRQRKAGCPACAGRAACRCNSLQALYPDTAAEWDDNKNKGQPSDYPASSHHLAWWRSPQRGSWQQIITSRASGIFQRTAKLRRIKQRQSFAS